MVKLDAQSGKVIQKSAKIPYANAASQISASGKYILNFINGDESVFGVTQVNVVNTATLSLKYALTQQRLPYIGFLFFENERLFITQDEDIKIWETANGKLLARIILIEGGTDWIVSTPDGRFDGSPGGLKQMHYVQGRESIPLEQLYEGFYTPNLLAEVMYGNGLKSSAPIEINQLKLPPTVRIVNKATGLRNMEVVDDETPNYESIQKTVLLSVEADGKTDKITEIRLYQNCSSSTPAIRRAHWMPWRNEVLPKKRPLHNSPVQPEPIGSLPRAQNNMLRSSHSWGMAFLRTCFYRGLKAPQTATTTAK